MNAPPSPELASARARRRALQRGLKRAAYALVGLVVVGGIVAAWMPRPLKVEVTLVARGPMRVTIDEDGRARVKDRYVVSAPIAGSLARIELQAGDDVKAGQALARIVPLLPPLLDERTRAAGEARLAGAEAAQGQARLQIERAQATYDLARAEVERLERLAAAGAASRQQRDDALLHQRRAAAELESLRFGARVAAHEVDMARASLSRLKPGRGTDELVVPSPVAGRVLKVMRESEGAVQAGTPLLEVGDPTALELVVDVLTSDAVRVRPGAPVLIERWGGAPLEARVRRVEPSAFTRVSSLGVEEQRVNVLLELASPRERWGALGDGYRVEARIVAWESPDVLRVPASALFRHGDGWALYRIEGDGERGRARLTPVQVGERNAREVQVTGGVGAGARVLLHPSDRVRDGVAVAGSQGPPQETAR